MGKAYRIPSSSDRLRKQQIAIRDLQALNRNRNTPRAVAATAFSGSSAAGSTGGGTGNFLPLSGGTLTGNIGFDPDLILVSNGRVDLDTASSTSESSTNILVTGQGTPDDIRFIDGAQRDGQILFYQGTNQQTQNLLNAISFIITNIVGDGATNTITVTVSDTTGLSNGDQVDISFTDNFNLQDAVVADLTATTFTYDLGETGSSSAETSGTAQTGNIYTNNGEDIELDGTLSLLGAPRIPLIFDSTIFAGGGWRPLDSAGGSGSGTVSFPITPTVNILGTVTTTQDIDLSLETAHTTSMTLGASISITFSNYPTTGTQIEWELEISQDNTGGFEITWPGEVTNPPTLGTTASSVVVVVLRTNDGGTTVRVANTVTTTSSLLALNNTWTGSNTFDGSPLIANGAITTLASTTSTSITSPLIILGDETTDTINFGGRLGTDLDPISDATKSLGSASLRYLDIYGSVIVGNTITASTSFSSTGATTLGDETSDLINFFGSANTDLDPISDATKSLGSASLRWLDIYGSVIVGNTITASTSFSSTGSTFLGDEITDTISFGGRVNTDIIPITDSTSDLGTTALRWDEIFVDKITLTAGSGVGFNSNLIPSTGLFTIGDSSNLWLTVFTDRIRLTTTTNTIFESSGDMVINSAADITFTIGSIAAGKILSSSEWDFEEATLSNVNAIGWTDGHLMTSLPTEVQLNLGAGDEFVIQDDATDFASFGETVTVLTRTSTSTVGHILRLRLDSSSPADGDFVGIVEFHGNDSNDNQQAYADIAGVSLDVTSGTEDGLMVFNVQNNGSSAKAFEVSANAGNIGIGFFGTTSIGNSQPDITGSRASNAALADLLTKLATLGLITDSTT